MCEISVQICNLKMGPLSNLNGFHVFPHDNIRKTYTVMHNPVFEKSDTLSFVLLACINFFIKMANNSSVAFSLLFSI